MVATLTDCFGEPPFIVLIKTLSISINLCYHNCSQEIKNDGKVFSKLCYAEDNILKSEVEEELLKLLNSLGNISHEYGLKINYNIIKI